MSDTKPPPEAVALPDAPTDGITRLKYLATAAAADINNNNNKSLLASTSWDGSVRVHDTASQSRQFAHAMESGPLMSLAVLGGDNSNANSTSLVTGGMDGSIRMVDLVSSTTTLVGRHETEAAPSDSTNSCCCSCLEPLSLDAASDAGHTLLVSAGWHKRLHLWDIRQSSSSPTATIELPGKAFAMDVDATHNRIVVSTSGRRTCFVDVRSSSTAKLAVERESSLKYQTRSVQFFPAGDAIAAGSVEGRVAVEYLHDLGVMAAGSNSKKKQYAFKCHRKSDIVYPVNAIEFHPRFGTFATGGCDGCVVMWDGLNKKKLTGLPAFPTSISALAFNYDGSELAIASSYTFEDGEREHPRDEIYVRPMLDSECKPKERSEK